MKRWLLRKTLPMHLLLTLVVVAWMPGTSTHAAGPVAKNPSYQETGTVMSLDLRLNQITVGVDRGYMLANNLTVRSGDRTVPRDTLKKGMRVGFNSISDQHKSTITDIWILPTR